MQFKLESLREDSVFMRHVRFDVTPEIIFKPRFIGGEGDRGKIEEAQGFSFYVDWMGEGQPQLMVMRTYNLTSKTLGEIEDAPEELLMAAVKRDGVKDYSGMYPIDAALEAWIKGKLGIL